jgi:hypothetical protein
MVFQGHPRARRTPFRNSVSDRGRTFPLSNSASLGALGLCQYWFGSYMFATILRTHPQERTTTAGRERRARRTRELRTSGLSVLAFVLSAIASATAEGLAVGPALVARPCFWERRTAIGLPASGSPTSIANCPSPADSSSRRRRAVRPYHKRRLAVTHTFGCGFKAAV